MHTFLKGEIFVRFLHFNPYQSSDAVKPVALARYLESFFSCIGGLLLVNLLFLVCCIPIITIGPSVVALHKVCCCAVRNRAHDLPVIFLNSFRQNLKTGICLAFTVFPLLLWLLSNTLAAVKSQNLPVMILLFSATLLTVSFSSYLFVLVAHTSLSPMKLLRNSFILMLAGKQYSIVGSFLSTALFSLQILYLPQSIPILLLIGCSLVAYNTSFFTWKIVDLYLFIPYYRAHPEEGIAEGYENDHL